MGARSRARPTLPSGKACAVSSRVWTANYARLGPQTTLMFVFMEHMRQVTGMKAL